MPSSSGEASKASAPLNENHKRTILYGCLDIHRRMAEMEATLTQSTISSPFSKYVNDLSPTETKVIQDYFARLRATLLAWLQKTDIPLDIRQTSTRWVLQCGMIFLQTAVAEMSLEKLRGYGELPEAGRNLVVQLQQEINRLIDRMGTYLRQRLGHDLSERLARLEAAPGDAATLTVLERIITRRRLVSGHNSIRS